MLLLAFASIAMTLDASGVAEQTKTVGTGAEKRPADWRVRPDRATATDPAMSFVDMRPGWHITTPHAVVFYRDGLRASGDFTVDTELFLFPNAQGGAGLIVGGAGLDGGSPRWVALLARGDGQFAIEERQNDTTRAVNAWAAGASIVRPSEKGPGRNVLRVRAIEDELVSQINDSPVASHRRSTLSVDGLIGLRAGDDANIHVTSLTVQLGGK
jgi:hypothetical protein